MPRFWAACSRQTLHNAWLKKAAFTAMTQVSAFICITVFKSTSPHMFKYMGIYRPFHRMGVAIKCAMPKKKQVFNASSRLENSNFSSFALPLLIPTYPTYPSTMGSSWPNVPPLDPEGMQTYKLCKRFNSNARGWCLQGRSFCIGFPGAPWKSRDLFSLANLEPWPLTGSKVL